jgi:hypothetical protein
MTNEWVILIRVGFIGWTGFVNKRTDRYVYKISGRSQVKAARPDKAYLVHNGSCRCPSRKSSTVRQGIDCQSHELELSTRTTFPLIRDLRATVSL